MLPQQYCLRWKHHSTNVQSMFSQLLEKERFCDVTVCSGGVSVRCHRAVLAAGSPLLGALLAAHDALAEPVLVIDQAEPRHLRPLLRYLYTGEMSVHHSQLAGLLKTAEELRIKGLSDIKWSSGKGPQQAQPTATATASEETGSARWDAPETTRTDPRTDSLHSVNGGPPPLIKLPVQSPARKRELTNEPEECGQGSPKRSRMPSRSDNTDEEEREPDWAQHGQMQDYGSEKAGSESEPEEGGSESETDFPPQDLARFLDTRLRVDGEHVAGEDEDSKGTDEKKMDGSKQTTSGMGIKACAATTSSSSCNSSGNVSGAVTNNSSAGAKPGSSADPRFSDVVKLNDYLLHGRRPHFWEEDYVRRVMEAVRLKELEMKQAAEILGVSYGTLYGRYRDVYGCINRPYRIKEFWSESSPAEVVQRVARGEVSLGQAADALAVPPQQLAAYITSLPAGGGSGGTGASGVGGTGAGAGRSGAATAVGGSEDAVAETSVEEPAPSGLRALRRTVAAGEKALKKLLVTDQDKPSTTPNKVPSIRVASLESLRAAPTQPNSVTADSTSPAAALLRTRPDLTIVPRGKPRLDSVT